MALLQADRKGADGATDQNSSEGDHDAERPGECHLQRGISVYNEAPWGFSFSHFETISFSLFTDPNGAGNEHDLQPARVQGIHRQ